MSKIILYIGGAKSGKSKAAVDYAKKSSANVAFIATCISKDESMLQRIENHKKERPNSWQTIENVANLFASISYIRENTNLIIVDSIGIYVSNLLLSNNSQEEIIANVQLVLESFKKMNCQVIFVSDETGLGVHPSSSLGNVFRDILGNVNQLIAADADEVLFFVAGLNIKIK